MDAIQARILNIKLDYLEQFNKRRAEIAAFYTQAFRSVPGIRVPETSPGVGHVWHQYALCCGRKDALGSFLGSKGVGSAAFYPVPLHLQKAFAGLGYKEGDLPAAEKITKQTVCLPIFPELTQKELDYVVQCVKEFCGQ
jgi:dTDP-4-amino-4,6-dideoxygalactose transaminase